jgi:hypothetical protein
MSKELYYERRAQIKKPSTFEYYDLINPFELRIATYSDASYIRQLN